MKHQAVMYALASVTAGLLIGTPPLSHAQSVIVPSLPLLAVNAPLTSASPKTFSTNFTVVNSSSTTAYTATLTYLRPDGTVWPSGPTFTSLNVPPDSNMILRQYADPAMPSGLGSGWLNTALTAYGSMQVGVAQIQARDGQIPSQGAYGALGFGGVIYVPLVVRNLASASGLSNSQLSIQNVGIAPVSVSVSFTPGPGSPGAAYQRSGIVIQPKSSYYYDIAAETNLPDGFLGSARVFTQQGTISVVANLFAGPHQLQTFSGVSVSSTPNPDDKTYWAVPLFMSRLTNGTSTSLSIQNMASSTVAVGHVRIECVADGPSSPATLTITNTNPVPAGGAFFVNPVIDTGLPDNWYGACDISAGTIYDQFAVLIQQRRPGVTDDGAAYLAIPYSQNTGGATAVTAPLIAKRLPNGFATAVTLMVPGAGFEAGEPTDPVEITLRYIPEGGGTPIVVGPVSLGDDGVTIRNHRLPDGQVNSEPALPDGWVGSLQVLSPVPIVGYVQLTNINPLPGDNLMALELYGY